MTQTYEPLLVDPVYKICGVDVQLSEIWIWFDFENFLFSGNEPVKLTSDN